MENWASIGPRAPSRYDNSRFSLTKSFGRLQADIPETRRGFNTLYVFLNVCRDCLNAFRRSKRCRIFGLHRRRLCASSSAYHLSKRTTAKKLVQGAGRGRQGGTPARYQHRLWRDQQLCDVQMA